MTSCFYFTVWPFRVCFFRCSVCSFVCFRQPHELETNFWPEGNDETFFGFLELGLEKAASVLAARKLQGTGLF